MATPHRILATAQIVYAQGRRGNVLTPPSASPKRAAHLLTLTFEDGYSESMTADELVCTYGDSNLFDYTSQAWACGVRHFASLHTVLSVIREDEVWQCDNCAVQLTPNETPSPPPSGGTGDTMVRYKNGSVKMSADEYARMEYALALGAAFTGLYTPNGVPATVAGRFEREINSDHAATIAATVLLVALEKL